MLKSLKINGMYSMTNPSITLQSALNKFMLSDFNLADDNDLPADRYGEEITDVLKDFVHQCIYAQKVFIKAFQPATKDYEEYYTGWESFLSNFSWVLSLNATEFAINTKDYQDWLLVIPFSRCYLAKDSEEFFVSILEVLLIAFREYKEAPLEFFHGLERTYFLSRCGYSSARKYRLTLIELSEDKDGCPVRDFFNLSYFIPSRYLSVLMITHSHGQEFLDLMLNRYDNATVLTDNELIAYYESSF